MSNLKPNLNLVSIIAAAYNEEELVTEFVSEVLSVIQNHALGFDYELIIVDDGSTDKTPGLLSELENNCSILKVITLARNFGLTGALKAGIDASLGRIVITMDSDLQHDPEEIPIFIEKLESGFDLVCGWRSQRNDGLLRVVPSAAANWVLRRISPLDIHDFGTTYRAYKGDLIRNLRLRSDFHRFIPALVLEHSSRICEIPIKDLKRKAGKSKSSLRRIFIVGLDLLILTYLLRFKYRPLRFFGFLSLVVTGIAFLIVTGAMIFTTNKVAWILSVLGFSFVAVMQLLVFGLSLEIFLSEDSNFKDKIYRIKEDFHP